MNRLRNPGEDCAAMNDHVAAAVLLAAAISAATFVSPAAGGGGGHHCVWYGRCGRDPKFGDDRHILNCLYQGPPKRAPAADVDKGFGHYIILL